MTLHWSPLKKTISVTSIVTERSHRNEGWASDLIYRFFRYVRNTWPGWKVYLDGFTQDGERLIKRFVGVARAKKVPLSFGPGVNWRAHRPKFLS